MVSCPAGAGLGWAGRGPQHGVQGSVALPAGCLRWVRGAGRRFFTSAALVYLGLPPHACSFSPNIAALCEVLVAMSVPLFLT